MSTNTVELAYVLHRRPYRESSLLIDFFSLNSGRISAIARGAKRPKSPMRACLQLFQPLYIDYYGHGELVTLKQAEMHEIYPMILPHRLPWAFYINELVFRLVERHEPLTPIFDAYNHVIRKISYNTVDETDLRYFEKTLLSELGYGLQLTQDVEQRKSIEADAYYYFHVEQGPSKTTVFKDNLNVYQGKHLLDLHNEQLETPESILAAKRLLRQAIQQLLNQRPLRSRELIL